MEAQSTDQLITQARQNLGLDAGVYNIAVVGHSGVGKSTLINGLRKLRDKHPDAAPVGETETTSKITKYILPNNLKIALWDVPGAGTLRHPSNTYFMDKMLYAFDCILVVSADRFMQVDFEIAQKTKAYNIPCAFVRTKADVAVKSIAERTHKLMCESSKDLRIKADQSLQKGLKDLGFSADTVFPLFVISAWAFTRGKAYVLADLTNGERADSSLQKMDEEQLQVFITNLVRAREKQRKESDKY
eukprot:c21971_g1_i1 orf=141-875(+)